MQGLAEIGLVVPSSHRIPLRPAIDVQEPGSVAGGKLQIDGPCSRGRGLVGVDFSAGRHEVLGDAGRGRNSVQQHLCFEGSRQRVGVVDAVFSIPRIGPAGELISPGQDDAPDQVLQIVSVLAKILGQPIQQTGMSGRIPQAEVVHRFHQPSSKEMAPVTIDGGPGEVRMVRHPASQLQALIGSGSRRQDRPVQEGGLHPGPVPGVGDLLEDQRGLSHLPVVLFLSRRIVKDDLVRPAPDVGGSTEEGGEPPELVLGPQVVGMVVALGAIHAAAEEDPELLRHHPFHVGPGPNEVFGGPVGSLGGNPLLGDQVVGLVGGQALTYPLPVVIGG